MIVNIKKLSDDAIIPSYAHATDAGMDLTTTGVEYKDGNFIYHTDLAFEVPEGYVMLLFPRSSNRKTEAYLTNSVGVIDSGYRGEVMVTFKSRDREIIIPPYNVGDRIAQVIILPYPKITFNEVEELSDSDRGTGGHGSTGK